MTIGGEDYGVNALAQRVGSDGVAAVGGERFALQATSCHVKEFHAAPAYAIHVDMNGGIARGGIGEDATKLIVYGFANGKVVAIFLAHIDSVVASLAGSIGLRYGYAVVAGNADVVLDSVGSSTLCNL